MAAAIAAGVTRMIRHDPGVRLGDDPEHVHQARVGTRRLRSDLRTFRSLLDGEWVTEMRAELGWAAAALGEVRDADVLTERMQARIASLPAADARAGAALLRRLATQRDAARARLLDVLNSDRYVALLDALSRAAADPPLLGPDDLDPSPSSVEVEPPTATARSMAAGPGGRPLGARSEAALDDAHRDGPVAAGCGFERCRRHSRREPPFPAATAAATEPEVAASPTAAWPEAGAVPVAPGDRPAREVLPRLVRRPWRHLSQAVEALGDHPEDEALHEVRIRAKRLRYAAEAATPVIGKPAQRFASAVAALQGVLGDMNDAVVAEAWLRQSSGTGSASQALVAGELIALERQEQQVGRDSWAAPWKAASQPRLRAWLKG